MFQTREMILQSPELQPTKRYDPDSEWWIILWEGIAAGYLIKEPTNRQLIDYDITIKLRDEMVTQPVLSGVLQKLVNIFQGWYDDELHILAVNNEKLTDEKFEGLNFLVAMLGLSVE